MYKNQKIFILGMARSGYEVAKVLLKRNNKVVISDAKEQNEEHVNELKAMGATVIISQNKINFWMTVLIWLLKIQGLIQKINV